MIFHGHFGLPEDFYVLNQSIQKNKSVKSVVVCLDPKSLGMFRLIQLLVGGDWNFFYFSIYIYIYIGNSNPNWRIHIFLEG